MTCIKTAAIVTLILIPIYCLLISWMTAGYLTTVSDRAMTIMVGLVFVCGGAACITAFIMSYYKEP